MTKELSNYGIRHTPDEPEIDDDSLAFRELKHFVCNLDKSSTYLKRFSSYKLKHIFERYFKDVTNGEISYFSNGELIKAMSLAGFEWKEYSLGSRNAVFKISYRSLKAFECYF